LKGPNLGKGGIDTKPSDERMPPAPPEHMAADVEGNPESASGTLNISDDIASRPKLLPRETGEDIGMGSPVPLSLEAVGVITRLRNMKVRMHQVDLFPTFHLNETTV
jgi:tRNA pseudouridine32 synthase